MRIVISGGTGTIGRPLTQALAEEGHEVIVLSRSPQKASFPHGVRGVAWDARTLGEWADVVDGAGAIVNLAGENIAGTGLIPQRWTSKRRKRIRESRWHAGQALVAAIEQAAAKPAVLFQMSGVDYYAAGDAVVTEESPPGETFVARVAAEAWEAATARVEALGVRRVIGRTGVVLDRQSGPLPLSVLQFRLFVGGRLGSGRQHLTWIHLDDLLRAIRFLLANENAAGVYNIAAPHQVTNQEFSRILGSVLGRPSYFPVPGWALELALGEVAVLVLQGRPVSVQRLQDLGFRFQFPELRQALADILQR